MRFDAPLVFAIDKACIEGLVFALRSLNQHADKPEVVVVAAGSSRQDFAVLNETYEGNLRLVPLHEVVEDAQRLAFLEATPYFLKFAALESQLADQLVFCDHDVAFMQPPIELLTHDLQGAIIAGSLDQGYSLKSRMHVPNQRLGLPGDYPYINTGVLVCDPEKIRKSGIVDRAIALYQANPKRFQYPDQCSLNLALFEAAHDQAKAIQGILPPRLNWQTPAMRLLPETLQPVHHFTGTKPWHLSSWHHHPKCKALYGWPARKGHIAGEKLSARKRISERWKQLNFAVAPAKRQQRSTLTQ